jgi:DNA-binding Xre family transcriptional regulator
MSPIEPQVVSECKPLVASPRVVHPPKLQPMVKLENFDVGAALNALIARSGKEKKALAAHMGVSEQAVQKWIKEGKLAREHVRQICLFLDCSADELLGLAPIRAETGSQSQLVRLDPAMIAETHAALRRRYAKVGGYNIEHQPELFAVAYEIRSGMVGASVPKNVFDLVIEHADLTPQGASSDGRNDGVPAIGGTERKTGGSRGRKT